MAFGSPARIPLLLVLGLTEGGPQLCMKVLGSKFVAQQELEPNLLKGCGAGAPSPQEGPSSLWVLHGGSPQAQNPPPASLQEQSGQTGIEGAGASGHQD